MHEDQEGKGNDIEKQLNGYSTVNFINRYRCKDGSFRSLEWESTPVANGLFYATARDITENMQVKEVLKENEYFLRESQRIVNTL